MDFIKKHWVTIAFIIILSMGIFARIYDFGNTPYGLNQDEASLGYDAWADMTYGMDRNGDHNSIYAAAWGSGQNMLYNYVTRPFIALFGLSIIAIRLPMMLSGIMTMILFYLFLKELFDQKTALLGLFLLAICPWHIMMSRWGLEANFVVFTAMLAMYLFVLAHYKALWFIPAMLASALCMYAYSASLVFLIVFIPAIVIYFAALKIVPWKHLVAGTAAFLITAIPMGVVLIVNKLELDPFRFLWFTVPNFSWMRPATPLFQEGNHFFKVLSDNIMRFKDMFIQMNDGFISNATKFGAIYVFLIPFIVIGIVRMTALLLDKKVNAVIPAIWFATALIQALIIEININRINMIFIPFILLAALGAESVFNRIKGLSYVTVITCILAFTAFSGYYFNDYNKDAQPMFFGGFDKIIKFAAEETDGMVYMSSHVNAPYMIVMFAQKIPPSMFASVVQYADEEIASQPVSEHARYVTGIPEDITPQTGDAFIIKYDEEIPPYLDINHCHVYRQEFFTVYTVK